METIYFYSAVLGGSVLVIQTALLVLGIGMDSDVDGHHLDDADTFDSGSGAEETFFKFLSIKTIVAFMTFFGLAGLASRTADLANGVTLAIALGAGFAAVWVVAQLMTGLAKLQSKGNIELKNAVGGHAKVYVRIPASHSGSGKVLVTVQGRRIECRAVTSGAELLSGAEVTVVALSSSDTLEVAPVAE